MIVKKTPTFAALIILLCTTACGVGPTPGATGNSVNRNANNVQIGAEAMVAHSDKQTGIVCDALTARELDKLKGVQGATVMLEGKQAYVGFHLIGSESVSPQERPHPSGRMIPVPYGRRRRTDESIQNGGAAPEGPAESPMYEPYPRGDLRTGPSSTRTGHIDPATKSEVTRIVRARTGANVIHITTKTANVGVLQGYANHIMGGGSLKPYIERFHRHMKEIWPT